jgi:5-oxoprolinase (ATP-hydrolysing) subunit A
MSNGFNKMNQSIDLNCDMGESFGAWRMGNDAALMDVVSSINVACGFHAGDATTMRETVQVAINKGVAIGAHPSFPDLQGFGRREMSLSSGEIFDIVLYQVAALKGICEAFGAKLHHVKPHGALYNMAAKDKKVAEAVAEAVKRLDEKLILFGLSGSFLILEAEKIGLKTASEVFADRTYTAEGFLTPRNLPDALINATKKSIMQVLQMIREQSVTATNGQKINIRAETICIHGDGAHALEFAQAISSHLKTENILIKSVSN